MSIDVRCNAGRDRRWRDDDGRSIGRNGLCGLDVMIPAKVLDVPGVSLLSGTCSDLHDDAMPTTKRIHPQTSHRRFQDDKRHQSSSHFLNLILPRVSTLNTGTSAIREPSCINKVGNHCNPTAHRSSHHLLSHRRPRLAPPLPALPPKDTRFFFV